MKWGKNPLFPKRTAAMDLSESKSLGIRLFSNLTGMGGSAELFSIVIGRIGSMTGISILQYPYYLFHLLSTI